MDEVHESQADIEHGGHKSQTGLNINFKAVMNFLGLANNSEHGKSGFDGHAVIPSAFRAEFDVIGNTVGTAEAPIDPHNFVPLIEIVQKGIIGHIHLVPNPASDASVGVEYLTDFDTHTPAPFIFILGTILLC